MKEIGKMVNRTGGESSCGQMERGTRESGHTTSKKARAPCTSQMEVFMKETGKMVKSTGGESKRGHVERGTREVF